MSCPYEQDLTAHLDGELSAQRALEVALHLDTCAECQRTEATLRQGLSALASLPAFAPSPAARAHVLSRIAALPEPRSFWAELLKARVWAPAAALATAGGVAVFIALHQPPHALTPAQTELAMNLELAENYEVLGLDSVEDADVVTHLEELEGKRP